MSAALADRVAGPVFTPADAGYAEEILAHNRAVVHTPDVVVGASSADDVVEAVRFAREHGYPVSVQSTGHGAHAPVSEGLFITTSRLTGVRVDPERRVAVIGAGARWGAVLAAAAEHGLAAIPGASGSVGVVGYLLGGGLGPLARSHGFSSDYVESFRVVTGHGELVQASADENEELYWALRGGKIGLGVVTELTLRLVQLDGLYAGSLFFDEPHIEAALRAWVEWTPDADPRVTTSVAIIRFPDLEFVPEVFRGRRMLSVRFAFPGDAAEGERLAAPLRAAAPTHLDALGELPPAEMARIHSDPDQPGPSWGRGMMLDHIDQDFATRLLGLLGAGTDLPFIATEIRHLGGATAHDVDGGSAVGGREPGFTFMLIGAPVPDLFDAVLPAAAQHVVDELDPWVSARTTINFASYPSEHSAWKSAWTEETFARLAAVRSRHDPEGVFPYGV
ncbi:FAD/FMN-containing dehydrogenase [Diaminobutyricimonas aerilata]|uniref:FAD/FMN-containing dehydrogenase n=1 Tax=Diaminobutyricimonas aerilata TaxID=1162967 RepID=A0A2M9CFF2_9MICO|nr:FAD-binding protein [Diaminobutyricimonas aerilata]PJJ70575.1 FAD/FMN-containing dehydrogenase [Diaminobutyricimonas aerilata]